VEVADSGNRRYNNGKGRTMNRRSLRIYGVSIAVGGGFALVVLLCLGVALVRSIKPISRETEEVRLAATQSAMPVAAGTSAFGTFLPSTGAPTSTGALPSTDTPGPSSTATDMVPITDTVGPWPTPTNTPSPNSTPAPVVIRGITDYVTDGERHVVGEVTNSTSGSIWFPKVVGTFYDAAGQVVITGTTYTLLDIVGVGEVAPFDLVLLQPPPSVDHYELQVEYAATDSPPLRVDIANHQGSVSDTGSYHVVGEVRNQNAFAVRFVKVVVTFYNAQGEVVRTDFSDPALEDTLSPGQKAPFEVVLLDPPTDMDHYAVKAQAYQ
jgi:hypothetical protein